MGASCKIMLLFVILDCRKGEENKTAAGWFASGEGATRTESSTGNRASISLQCLFSMTVCNYNCWSINGSLF